jgi:hypothetical protein
MQQIASCPGGVGVGAVACDRRSRPAHAPPRSSPLFAPRPLSTWTRLQTTYPRISLQTGASNGRGPVTPASFGGGAPCLMERLSSSCRAEWGTKSNLYRLAAAETRSDVQGVQRCHPSKIMFSSEKHAKKSHAQKKSHALLKEKWDWTRKTTQKRQKRCVRHPHSMGIEIGKGCATPTFTLHPEGGRWK